MQRYARLLLAIFLSVLITPIKAAEIVLRPDLTAKILELRSIYERRPWVGAPYNSLRLMDDFLLEQLAAGERIVVELRGVIEPGDADALRQALFDPNDDPGFKPPVIVVLNSPGGDFLEGLRIGDVLRERRFGNDTPSTGVLVEQDGQCLSACALAFVTSALPGEIGGSDRFIEVGGRLGFHMPFVAPEAEGTTVSVQSALDIAYDVMAQYIRIVSNRTAPSALLENAILHRGADEFYILEGGLVSRFMGFVPVARGRRVAPIAIDGLTVAQVETMCRYLVFSRGWNMNPGEYEFWQYDDLGAGSATLSITEFLRDEGVDRIDYQDCAFERRADGTLGIGTFEQSGPLPPATAGLLADVMDCHGGRLTRRYYTWDWDNQFLEDHWEEAGVATDPTLRLDWTRELTANVNVRMRPNPGSRSLGTLGAGTPVRVLNCALRPRGQGVWFKIAEPEGWVSARYVSAPQDRRFWTSVIRPAGRN